MRSKIICLFLLTAVHIFSKLTFQGPEVEGQDLGTLEGKNAVSCLSSNQSQSSWVELNPGCSNDVQKPKIPKEAISPDHHPLSFIIKEKPLVSMWSMCIDALTLKIFKPKFKTFLIATCYFNVFKYLNNRLVIFREVSQRKIMYFATIHGENRDSIQLMHFKAINSN